MRNCFTLLHAKPRCEWFSSGKPSLDAKPELYRDWLVTNKDLRTKAAIDSEHLELAQKGLRGFGKADMYDLLKSREEGPPEASKKVCAEARRMLALRRLLEHRRVLELEQAADSGRLDKSDVGKQVSMGQDLIRQTRKFVNSKCGGGDFCDARRPEFRLKDDEKQYREYVNDLSKLNFDSGDAEEEEQGESFFDQETGLDLRTTFVNGLEFGKNPIIVELARRLDGKVKPTGAPWPDPEAEKDMKRKFGLFEQRIFAEEGEETPPKFGEEKDPDETSSVKSAAERDAEENSARTQAKVEAANAGPTPEERAAQEKEAAERQIKEDEAKAKIDSHQQAGSSSSTGSSSQLELGREEVVVGGRGRAGGREASRRGVLEQRQEGTRRTGRGGRHHTGRPGGVKATTFPSTATQFAEQSFLGTMERTRKNTPVGWHGGWISPAGGDSSAPSAGGSSWFGRGGPSSTWSSFFAPVGDWLSSSSSWFSSDCRTASPPRATRTSFVRYRDFPDDYLEYGNDKSGFISKVISTHDDTKHHPYQCDWNSFLQLKTALAEKVQKFRTDCYHYLPVRYWLESLTLNVPTDDAVMGWKTDEHNKRWVRQSVRLFDILQALGAKVKLRIGIMRQQHEIGPGLYGRLLHDLDVMMQTGKDYFVEAYKCKNVAKQNAGGAGKITAFVEAGTFLAGPAQGVVLRGGPRLRPSKSPGGAVGGAFSTWAGEDSLSRTNTGRVEVAGRAGAGGAPRPCCRGDRSVKMMSSFLLPPTRSVGEAPSSYSDSRKRVRVGGRRSSFNLNPFSATAASQKPVDPDYGTPLDEAEYAKMCEIHPEKLYQGSDSTTPGCPWTIPYGG